MIRGPVKGTNEASVEGLGHLPPLFTDQEWAALSEHFGLTHRQTDVARLICHGLATEQIARVLNITPNTVRMHKRALFDALDVHCRVGVAVRLMLAIRSPEIGGHAPTGF